MVLGCILGKPGANYTTMKRRLNMNNGSLSWHLNKLEKDELIKSLVQGTRKRYYPVEMPLPEEDGGELPDIEKRLQEAASKGEGVLVSDLASQLGISRQLALYHLRTMHGKGFITLERRGLHLVAVYPPHHAG